MSLQIFCVCYLTIHNQTHITASLFYLILRACSFFLFYSIILRSLSPSDISVSASFKLLKYRKLHSSRFSIYQLRLLYAIEMSQFFSISSICFTRILARLLITCFSHVSTNQSRYINLSLSRRTFYLYVIAFIFNRSRFFSICFGL